MAYVRIPGFRQYTSAANKRSVNPADVTEMFNMQWIDNAVETRKGSKLFKSNAQTNWGRVRKFKDFKILGDSYFYVVAILDSGRVFYIRSDDVTYGSSSATWTELNSPAGATPALGASAYKYDLYGFNNRLYLTHSANNYRSTIFGSSNLIAEANPPDLSTNNIVSLGDKSARLAALDDGGRTHLSANNNGQDFTVVSGGGSLLYGRTEGLRASSIVPFGDDLIIATEDSLLRKFQVYRLLGIQFFDDTVPGTEQSQFEVRKVNSIAGVIGGSAQEIANDTIGLTPRGFIGMTKAITNAGDPFTERDFISYPIKEIIQQINFKKSDKISSCVDFINGRYLCAVPFGTESDEANMILVYDFQRSSPSEGIYRWAIWGFNWGDIGVLGTIQGVPYVTDIDGNMYELNNDEANYSDNNLSINYIFTTAHLGGNEIDSTKDFSNAQILFTNLSADKFPIDINAIADGNNLINVTPYGDLLAPIEVEQLPRGIRYDDPGVFYDSFNFYDGGADQRIVTLDRGGKSESMAWQFTTNTTGVSWGIGSFAVDVTETDSTSRAGLNNLVE